MSLNLNKVILAGRIVADPELKQTQSGVALVSFRLAVNRRFNGQQNEADFFNVTAWRAQAEFVSRYFKKGSSIFVVGTIQNRSWTDQQGVKRYATDIVADEISFVDSRNEGPAAGQGQYTPDAYTTPSYSTPADSAPRFEEIKGDDDLPF